MKICHINLARGYRGGERQTELLIKHLTHLGVEQRALLRPNHKLVNNLRENTNIDVRTLGLLSWLGRGLKGVDLLHAHEAKAAHMAFINKVLSGVPYIITRRVPNMPGNDPLTRRVYRSADGIVALSNAIRDVLLDYEPSLDVKVIPSMLTGLPINQEFVESLKVRYKGRFVVGHIGALQMRHKGQQYLIEVARLMQSSAPKVVFLFLGEGEDEAELKRQAKDLSNVEFLGFKENVIDYLKIFDLFAFPSLKEGLGSVLLDVLQHGCPIVASAVDGIKELIQNGENGLLVPPRQMLELCMMQYFVFIMMVNFVPRFLWQPKDRYHGTRLRRLCLHT